MGNDNCELGKIMEKYIYKNPIDNGFIKFKLSRRQHEKLFPKRKRNWATHYDYYMSDDDFLMHRTSTVFFKICAVLAFPLVILMEGASNMKEILMYYSDLFNEKQHGSFHCDSVDAGTEKYNQIKTKM